MSNYSYICIFRSANFTNVPYNSLNMSFELCPPPQDRELAVRNPQSSIETYSQLQQDQYAYWSRFAVDNPHTLIRAEAEIAALTSGRVEQSYISMLWNQDTKPEPGPEHQERHRRRQLSAAATTLLLRIALENTLFDDSLDINRATRTIDMYDDRDGIPHVGRVHLPAAVAMRALGKPRHTQREGAQWFVAQSFPSLVVQSTFPARPTPQQVRVLRAKQHIVNPATLVTLTPHLRMSR